MLFSLAVVLYSSGCRGSKGQRRAYKMQNQSGKKGANDHEDLLKAHYDRQSEETKRMMKEMKKENKKMKKNKKRSLKNRAFHKKCR